MNFMTGILGLLTAGLILYLVRRDHMHTKYALWWMPLALVIALLGLFPGIVDWIAPFLGVHYSPILPIIIGLVVVMIKMLVMDVGHSRNEVKIQRLVQRLAILETKLKQLEKDNS